MVLFAEAVLTYSSVDFFGHVRPGLLFSHKLVHLMFANVDRQKGTGTTVK